MSRALLRLLSARRAWLLLLPGGAALWGASLPERVSSALSSTGAPQDGAQIEPAQSSGPWRVLHGQVHSTLPSEASGAVTVSDSKSGVSLGFRLAGALPAAASWIGGSAHYAGALGEGTELELRAKEQGVEDLVHFERRPAQERVDYLVDLRGVAGVRKVGEVVEFVDEGGAPRLRMEAPYVVSARGEVVRGRVEVGCEHDEEARGPWGRKAVKGGEECRVSVEWGGRGVEYPAVLDPVWSAATSMNESRGYPNANLLPSGRVLVTSGRTCAAATCVSLSTCELYDPASNSWAMTGALASTRDRFKSVMLPDGRVFASGGDSGSASSSDTEIYEESTGLWKMVASMLAPRTDAVSLLLSDQKTVVVLGGVDLNTKKSLTSVELYDIASDTWSSGGQLQQARFWSNGVVLPDGRVLIAGGTTCDNCGPMKPSEIYDPVSKTSQVVAPMITARLGHGVVMLQVQGSPKMLAVGGGTEKAEYYDPGSNTWTAIGGMSENRAFFTTLVRPDGSVLVTGGGNIPFFNAIKGVERLDPVTLTWSKAASMTVARTLLGAVTFSDGRVMAIGGVAGNILSNGNTTPTAEIFQPSAVAEPCLSAGDCQSGFCVDGVCCESACTGVCMACSAAKKGGGADGVCGAVALNTDPDSECEAQDKSTCGTSGECDGKGACAKYAVNTPCGTATCTDGVSTGLLCSADGKCLQQVASCAPFLCASTTSCSSSCAVDLDCVSSAHCAGQVCVGDLGQGEACTRGAECGSGFCVDGVCCESACEGTCQACAGKLKEGGGADGVCGPALADSDPHDDCEVEPEASCDKNGLCDGKGACASYPAGTSCQPPTCVIDETGVRVDSFACDGSGTCKATSNVSCGFFGCDQGSCGTTCSTDDDCAPRAYCDEGTCVARKALGAICQDAHECLEGFCVDGVCCNSACDGQCEACDVDAALGLCVPVSGVPHNTRAACAEGAAGKPCEQRTCDGVNRDSCEGFVGLAVSCKEPSCEGGIETPEGRCDGKGSCQEPEPVRCEPFVCKGAVCVASCSSDADCSEKFRCDLAKGDCVPRTGAFCEDEGTLVNPDGTKTSCAPFACEGSSCKTQCSSVKDCVLPNICDEVTRTCLPSQPNVTDSAGCQLSPGAPGSTLAALGWLAALVIARRRRALSRG